MEFNFEKSLSSTIQKMYQEKETTGDFVINCNGSKVSCHKVVLVSSSPVFKGMIKSKMKESKEEEMKLDSFSIKTVEIMVGFFYKKTLQINLKMEDILGNVDYTELLNAAEFFQVPLLKKVCEYSLLNQMTRGSALEFYKSAKLYNAEILMNKSRKMIICCKDEIMNVDGWKQELKELNDQDLLIEMLEKNQARDVYTNSKNSMMYSYTTGIGNSRPYSYKTANVYECRYDDQDALCFANPSYHYGTIAVCREVPDDMLSSLATLFNDADTSDLSCSVDDDKVLVHEAFVKVNSEQLLKKISTDEKIDYIEKDILEFLYTGQIVDYAKKAKELIELAHTFKLPMLKSYCDETLIATLSVENVFERFIFASKNESEKLRMKALAMIVKENKNVMKTENWRSLAQENVDIVFELGMECFSELKLNK